MGNSVSQVVCCFLPKPEHDAVAAALFTDPLDEGLGHSFCYIRPVLPADEQQQQQQQQQQQVVEMVDSPPQQLDHHEFHQVHHPPIQLQDHLQLESPEAGTTKSCISETSFKSISGASVSANTAAPRSIVYNDSLCESAQVVERAATFESTASFTALPLQPIPRGISFSGPISVPSGPLNFLSGPLERGFLSGPIERGFMSGPLDQAFPDRSNFSAPLVYMRKRRRTVARVIRRVSNPVKNVLSRTVSNLTRASNRSVVAPMKSFASSRDSNLSSKKSEEGMRRDLRSYLESPQSNGDFSDVDGIESHNLHWAQGKAGEDRVHVVLSEEHGWLFVGIYDGFSGPDATDFLMRNLYPAIYGELKGLLWDQKQAFQLPPRYPKRTTLRDLTDVEKLSSDPNFGNVRVSDLDAEIRRWTVEVGQVASSVENGRPVVTNMRSLSNRFRKVYSRRRRSQQRRINQCRYEWEQERMMAELQREEQRQKQLCSRRGAVNHAAVLKALGRALEATEESYLEMIDDMFEENPEVALMGSCVLVMLIKDEDVYVMNVGDSRAVLAQHRKAVDLESLRQRSQDAGSLELERIVEETPTELAEAHNFCVDDDDDSGPHSVSATLGALQLSMDHSTKVLEEAMRIMSAHPDDSASIYNDRVKGKLAVTRAFGAGYLKQPRWNDALLEVFRINFVGNSPYISCVPHLHHHKLCPQDQFLVLSSDGLYQYLTNEEVVSHVEWFMDKFPDGDPAQYLIEIVLFRAAKKAGMEFHDLLDIPQGDRRKYHDDLSVMVVSLEGRIWRSSSQSSNR